MEARHSTASRFIAEEIVNSITHGIGCLASCLGLVLLLGQAIPEQNSMKIICFGVYGFSMIFLFGSSTLYHWFHAHRHAGRLQVLDHAAIFLLIAGSYTPFSLLVLRGGWGWTIFGIIWSLALLGILFKLMGGRKYRRFSVFLYLLMGWLVIIAIKPLVTNMPEGAMFWVISGGLSYSVGVIFYMWDKLWFNHAIWHVFVLGGALSHFLAVYWYLVPLK